MREHLGHHEREEDGDRQGVAAAHAVFGLINSTPHSAGRLPAPAMAALLATMAEAAATA